MMLLFIPPSSHDCGLLRLRQLRMQRSVITIQYVSWLLLTEFERDFGPALPEDCLYRLVPHSEAHSETQRTIVQTLSAADPASLPKTYR